MMLYSQYHMSHCILIGDSHTALHQDHTADMHVSLYPESGVIKAPLCHMFNEVWKLICMTSDTVTIALGTLTNQIGSTHKVL